MLLGRLRALHVSLCWSRTASALAALLWKSLIGEVTRIGNETTPNRKQTMDNRSSASALLLACTYDHISL